MRSLPRALRGLFAAFVLSAGSSTTSALPPPARAVLAPIDEADAQASGRGADGSRSRLVLIRPDQLPRPGEAADRATPVLLNLFPDVAILATFDRFDPNARGITWVGRVEGVPGSAVTLVYRDGRLTGSIVTPTASYAIRPAPGGRGPVAEDGVVHTVTELHQGPGRPEAKPIRVDLPAAPAAAADRGGARDTADFIDVMVVYSPAAAAFAGGQAGMEGLLALAISESNTSYANSGIHQRLRLAHSVEVSYVETDLETDLVNVQSGAAPFEDVGPLRDAHLADVVVLVQSSPVKAFCGLAFQMTTPTPAFEAFAYSAVEVDCISPGYTFQHELGHTMGAHHDWFSDGPATPSYAHGHVHTDAEGPSWTTIMSTLDLCTARGVSCSRLLYWSNPDVLLDGVPMGVPEGTNSTCLAGDEANAACDADDHRRLNETALVVANFRSSPPPAAFAKDKPADAAAIAGAMLALSWHPSANVDSYEYCLDTTFDATCDQLWMPVGPSLSVHVSSLSPATAYNWQVRARNPFGTTAADDGAWWGFSTPGVSLARYDPYLKAPRCGPVARFCDSGTAVTGAGSMAGGPEPHHPNTIGESCTDSAGLTFHVDQSIDRIRVFSTDSLPISAGRAVTIEVTAWITDPGVDRIDLYHAANASWPTWAYVGTVAPSGNGSQVMTINRVLGASARQAVRARLRSTGVQTPCQQTGFEDHDDLVFAVGPPPNVDLAANGSFSGGQAGWLQFSTPDASYIHVDTSTGVMQFYRVAPPSGPPNQAVVYQHLGAALGSGVPLEATFRLGNSDSVRKRVSVLVHDSDFSDLAVCTFWLGPGAPLTAYSMRTHTTKAWSNATISFYAASANAAGNVAGFYQLDDVSVRIAPALSTTQTVCADPTAPPGGFGGPGPDWIGNGDFAAGAIAPWQLFGQIGATVSDSVFEFIKLPGAPAGVVFQITSQPVNAGEILTATFDLGNSSPVRKRVTAILHDSSFSDLSACTFWLAPGQPLSAYTYRTFATAAWTSATLSIYPATTGPEAWIRLDNATLQRTPAVSIAGTECIEPAGIEWADDTWRPASQPQPARP